MRVSEAARPVRVRARDGYRIWIRYSDGVEGEVDLSALAGKGVFRVWEDPGVFAGVHVSPHGSIAWSDELEICPDALHMELSGKSAEDHFGTTRRQPADA